MGHFWSRSQRGLLEFNPFLRSMGSSFWVAWITILYSEKAVLGNFSAARTVTSDAFVASTIALAVSLVVLGSLPKVARSLIDRAPAMFGLSVVAAVATLAIGFGGMLPPWAVSVSALVTGAVTALIVLRVGTVYSEMDTRDAVIALGFSLILGVLIFSFAIMLAPSLPPAPLVLAVFMLPLAVTVLYVDARNAVEYQHQPPRSMPEGFNRVLVSIFLLSFALCCIRGYYPNFLDSGGFSTTLSYVALFLLVGAGAFSLAAAALPRNAPFGTYTYWLLLACSCAALVLPVFGMHSVVAGIMGSVLFGMALLSVFGLLSRISYRSGASVVRAFGWGFGAASGGTAAGFSMGYLIVGLGMESEGLLIDVLILTACVIVAVFLLRRRDLERLMEPVEDDPEILAAAEDEAEEAGGEVLQGGSPDSAHAPGSAEGGALRSLEVVGRAPFRERCEMLSEECSLSAREQDVFMLLARGKDARAIANELFVSYNTARTHVRNVYSKMGVHSRRELLELVDIRKS